MRNDTTYTTPFDAVLQIFWNDPQDGKYRRAQNHDEFCSFVRTMRAANVQCPPGWRRVDDADTFAFEYEDGKQRIECIDGENSWEERTSNYFIVLNQVDTPGWNPNAIHLSSMNSSDPVPYETMRAFARAFNDYYENLPTTSHSLEVRVLQYFQSWQLLWGDDM